MKITVENDAELTHLQVTPGADLLSYLQDAQLQVDTVCGGKGTCQKCRVQLVQGFLPPSPACLKAFSPQECQAGWRLSCQVKPRTHVQIAIPKIENFRVKPRVCKHEVSLSNPRLVCDLGSTGVVLALGDNASLIEVEAHLLNRQVRYGSDVMTRLDVAQKRGSAWLHQTLHETLEKCLEAIRQETSTPLPDEMICAGNSAMTSFLHNWPIDTLAVSPFQPVCDDAYSSERKGLKLTSLPLLGGFVGADTTAGILYLQSLNLPKPWMMVDIGTNTEIVLVDENNRIWFSSAPAGPAFEGGNITKGMRAEPGAIAHAVYDGKWQLETIGNDLAKGICGSGLIDIMHESVRHGLITQDGYVPQGKLPINERVFVLADDVREFQLAKSATRSAIEVLMHKSGTTPKIILMAGNFAEHLRRESVVGVGLLPAHIDARVVGNASLKGAFLYAQLNEQARIKFAENLRANSQHVELALQDEFQEIFIQHLNFNQVVA